MALKVALQMDPIGSVNINADSTFRIALEAQARGHSLFHYTPDRLAFVASMERHMPIAVIEVDGWFIACATERTIAASEVSQLRATEGAPRIMSLATERGITPALGPLVA